jgi:hypothetical protein
MNSGEVSQGITAEIALDWVDTLLRNRHGWRLNDLERQVFIGSWHGYTYEKIHPTNPQYVEKSVGYKLWRKLSAALGEKVSKKHIQGVVMRHLQRANSPTDGRTLPVDTPQRICILPASLDQGATGLALALGHLLESIGHQVSVDLQQSTQAALQIERALLIHPSVGQWDWILLVNPGELSSLAEQS